MEKKVLKRNEVNQQETWDLTRLYQTEADYETAILQLEKLSDTFVAKYKEKLTSAQMVNAALDDVKEIYMEISYTDTYQSLHMASDQTNEENGIRSGKYSIFYGELEKKMVFFSSELEALDVAILTEAAQQSPANRRYLTEVVKNLKHKLSPEAEKVLAELGQVLSAPYENYAKFKLSDMVFDNFEANGKSFEQSFSLFENGWQEETDTAIRRAAFENFYSKLGQYESGFAHNYQTQVLTEKAHANLRGFKTTTDYLLQQQDVSEAFYDRQIELLMEHLAVPMRKYVKLLKDIHGLDKLTYADLHLSVDPDFEPDVTVEASQKYAIDGLAILGGNYKEMIEKSFSERWIDFPQSIGKSTGGFCSSPYGKGSYILLNWNNKMNETFVLAHELGHAGHFYFAAQEQNILDTRSSLYFIEAPSTMNEIIMAEYLKGQSEDPRFKRWVLSNMVSRTYYHNCVTHLLEAHYQREVYRCVEAKKPLTAKVLNDLFLATLKKFWGDDVEIPEYAGRTWMRQPHYFMGLYPYTYSAGLTISTAAYNKIKKGELPVEKWLDVLRAGGSKDPIALAKMADVDLSTEAPLMEMINYVAEMVDEIVAITDQLK